MIKYLIPFFLIISTTCRAYESTVETSLFTCNAIDFNGSATGYGHFQPFDTEPNSIPDQNKINEYSENLIDQSKIKPVFASDSFGEVWEYCKNFAEANMDFIDHSGSCSLMDGDGNLITDGTWSTAEGAFLPKNFEGALDTSLASWQMIYWHYAACEQGGVEGEAFAHFPLPFVLQFDSFRDCEEGCPIENGVDAYNGSVRKPISPLKLSGVSTLANIGELSGMGNKLPLNFVYSTDVSSDIKPIDKVTAQWINSLDIRMTGTSQNPYLTNVNDDYNWDSIDPKSVNIWRPSGRVQQFFYVKYDSRAHAEDGWLPIDIREEGKLTGANGIYQFKTASGDTEYYRYGLLRKIKKQDGSEIRISHLSSSSKEYEMVKGEVGLGKHSISKNSNGAGYDYLIGFGNQSYRYSFDSSHRLLEVVLPTSTPSVFETIRLKYEDPRNENLLTSAINQNNDEILTYEYDEFGRVISTSNGEYSSSSEIVFSSDGTRTVNDSLGREKTYSFLDGKISSITCPECGGNEFIREFDAPDGRESLRVDFNGLKTERVLDENGLEQMVISEGPDFEFSMTTYSWDVDKRLPTSINKNGFIIDFEYDENGLLANKIEQETKVTQYTHDAFGNLTSIDGPREDVDDITTFHYLENGLLEKVVNAKAQVTYEVLDYDDLGRAVKVKNIDGLVTHITFNVNNKVSSILNGEREYLFSYTNTGNLETRTFPDGRVEHYNYDQLGRLIGVTDGQLNQLVYHRDLRGNVVSTQFSSSDGVVHYSISNDYGANNYLSHSNDGEGDASYEYDLKGNRVLELDGNGNEMNRVFNALGQLVETVDQINGVTQLEYDEWGNVSAVIDPEDRVTEYYFNDFMLLEELFSPDTGSTLFNYDDAGNLIEKTDARNIVEGFRYDELNRKISIEYEDPTENVVFEYDSVANNNFGLGALTSVQDETGSNQYFYNQYKELVKEIKHIEGEEYQLFYQYDDSGRVKSVIYPSGRIINYEYDTHGNLITITTRFENETKNLVSEIKYLPFGPVSQLQFGNGIQLTNEYDNYYRLTGSNAGDILSKSYGYDLVGNIELINDVYDASASQLFEYDNLSRLIFAQGGYGEFEYSYDGVGNRLSKSENSEVDEYVYSYDSLQLDNIIGESETTFAYDEAGNTIQKNEIEFTYNQAGRLQTATAPGINAYYRYNYRGERVFKQVNGVTQHYIYNPSGQLIAEANSLGEVTVEYVYFNDLRIATIKDESIYYVHSNHIGAPIALTDENGEIQWKANYTPFGELVIEVDNLEETARYPGQYFDAETGLYYNYFRDYDPEIGRYIQSDPIGLAGGINTYGYVHGNPIKYSDPFGLCAPACTTPLARPVPVNPGRGVAGDFSPVPGYEAAPGFTHPYSRPSQSFDFSFSKTAIGVGLEALWWYMTQEETDDCPNLPENAEDLLNHGWNDVTDQRMKDRTDSREYYNPKTGERVRFDPGKRGATGWEARDHYHRYNPDASGKGDYYLDRNGNPVPKNSKPSHIPPN